MALTAHQRIAKLEAQLAERDAQLAERDAQLAEHDAQLAERDAQLSELTAKLEAALAQIAVLKAKVNKNSKNSSMPPSSDKPWNKPARKPKKRGKRKRGGQKGHQGHRRELLPPEKVRNTHDVHPEQCDRCGGTHLVPVDDSEPLRHQVTDLPPVEPSTDEWRLHLGQCQDCDALTRAALPAGVPTSNFGHSITALVALLTAVYRVSKRGVQALLSDVFNVTMSLGSIPKCEQRASEAVAEPVTEAHQWAQDAEIAHADETGWRERGKKMWLWVMATTSVSVFFILPGRGSRYARHVLGRFKGILVSDRYKGYLFYTMGLRQICWSHLIRDFQALSERGGIDGDLAGELVELTWQMFSWWHRVCEGTMARSTFRRKMGPLRREVEELLEWGAEYGVRWGVFEDLLKHRKALWTFVRVEGVEPTNNHAEQQVRHPVLLRKMSLGTQSIAGSQFVERMLTVVSTLRKQGRNVHGFLSAACSAKVSGSAPPSLLPDQAINKAA